MVDGLFQDGKEGSMPDEGAHSESEDKELERKMKQTGYMNRKRMRKNFSLIELLVVAVIAILISVLLPALSASRDKAMSLSCMSKVKTIGQAILLYADMWDDMTPSLRENGDIYWTYTLYKSKLLQPKDFFCPGRREDQNQYWGGLWRKNFADPTPGYCWQFPEYGANPKVMPFVPRKLSHIKRPSETIELADSNKDGRTRAYYYISHIYSVSSPVAYPFHASGRALNIFWVDGHVSMYQGRLAGEAGAEEFYRKYPLEQYWKGE